MIAHHTTSISMVVGFINRPNLSGNGAYVWRDQMIVGPGPRGSQLKLEVATLRSGAGRISIRVLYCTVLYMFAKILEHNFNQALGRLCLLQLCECY
jgi:hypothetical protein